MPPVPGPEFPTTGSSSPTQGNGAPTSPPPPFIPQKPTPTTGYTLRIDPFVIQYCLGKTTYMWLKDGSEF